MDLEGLKKAIYYNNKVIEFASKDNSTVLLLTHENDFDVLNFRDEYADEFKKKMISFCKNQNRIIKRILSEIKSETELDFNITDK